MGLGMGIGARYTQAQMVGWEGVENTVLSPASSIIRRLRAAKKVTTMTFAELEEIEKDVIALREYVMELTKYPWRR